MTHGIFDTVTTGLKSAASNLVASDIKGVTVSSAYTEPLTYSGQQLVTMANSPVDPNAPHQIFGRILKPTITIDSGMAGRYTIAPYGAALPNEWQRNQIAAGVLIGASAALFWAIGFKMGRTFKK